MAYLARLSQKIKGGSSMEITKKMLVDIRPEIEEALKGVADKFGISMSLGNGVYG